LIITPKIRNPTKLPGTPATNAMNGVVRPKGVKNMISPIKDPKAAPEAPIKVPNMIENKAGIITPGLNCPIENGVGIAAVIPMVTA
jgi:hypothetical protein